MEIGVNPEHSYWYAQLHEIKLASGRHATGCLNFVVIFV